MTERADVQALAEEETLWFCFCFYRVCTYYHLTLCSVDISKVACDVISDRRAALKLCILTVCAVGWETPSFRTRSRMLRRRRLPRAQGTATAHLQDRGQTSRYRSHGRGGTHPRASSSRFWEANAHMRQFRRRVAKTLWERAVNPRKKHGASVRTSGSRGCCVGASALLRCRRTRRDGPVADDQSHQGGAPGEPVPVHAAGFVQHEKTQEAFEAEGGDPGEEVQRWLLTGVTTGQLFERPWNAWMPQYKHGKSD